MLVLY